MFPLSLTPQWRFGGVRRTLGAMFRAATLSLTILSVTAFVGCEKKPSTSPDDAADSGGDGGGDVAGEGGDAAGEGGGEESKPEEDAGGGW